MIDNHIHDHIPHREQQTGHTFCAACGKHIPPDPDCPDQPAALWVLLQDPEYKKLVTDIVDKLSPASRRYFGR